MWVGGKGGVRHEGWLGEDEDTGDDALLCEARCGFTNTDQIIIKESNVINNEFYQKPTYKKESEDITDEC